MSALDVLAIEDNPGDVRLIREALEEDERVRVRVAWDGAEALDMLQHESRPDLILLDINLPSVGGLELLARMREDPNLANIPVVVFTSSRLVEDVRDAEGSGAAMFVVKPFDVLEYLATLRRIRRRFVEEITPAGG
jgi:two-component system, chemotaxis family, response regulator Rcp1